MKVEYINPFIQATENSFKMLCGLDVERNGSLRLSSDSIHSKDDVFGVVNVSGEANGSIAIVIPPQIARKIIKIILQESTLTDEDLLDGVGEILNTIVGGATAQLPRVKISAPKIMFGKDPKYYRITKKPWVVIPMHIPDKGEFSIEVSFDD